MFQTDEVQIGYISLICFFTPKLKPKMQKRVLPSAEVSLASKVFEKFFAAHEFEDILTHHKDLCEILQIKAGLLSECYPVIKVSLKSRTMFSTL